MCVVPSVTSVCVSGKIVATCGSNTVPPAEYSDGPMRSSVINAPLLGTVSESLLAKPTRFLAMGLEAPAGNRDSTAAETGMERMG